MPPVMFIFFSVTNAPDNTKPLEAVKLFAYIYVESNFTSPESKYKSPTQYTFPLICTFVPASFNLPAQYTFPFISIPPE